MNLPPLLRLQPRVSRSRVTGITGVMGHPHVTGRSGYIGLVRLVSGSLVLGALLLPRAAQATPTGDPFPGPTGLGVIPTTQTVRPGHFDVSLNYEYFNLNGSSGHADNLPFANVSYGFKNGEVGAAYLRQKTDVAGFSSSNSYYAAHAKYRVYHTPDGKFNVALGAHYYDFGTEDDLTLGSVTSLYATGSYEFRNGDTTKARLHLGLLGQRAHYPGDSNTYARPFAGVEVPLSGGFSIGADYLDKHGDVARAYTLSARYQPVDKPFSAQIGVGRLRSDTKFFVGVGYSLGRK